MRQTCFKVVEGIDPADPGPVVRRSTIQGKAQASMYCVLRNWHTRLVPIYSETVHANATTAALAALPGKQLPDPRTVYLQPSDTTPRSPATVTQVDASTVDLTLNLFKRLACRVQFLEKKKQ